MIRFIISLYIALSTTVICSQVMPPPAFSLRLQKGITGGFAPPTPDAVHTIERAEKQDLLTISSAARPHGTAELQPATYTNLHHAHEDTPTLLKELHETLKKLPTEQPPGSQDIYGLDTSIAWFSDDLEWYNGGPAGCGGGESYVKATQDEKDKFKRAVEIVGLLVGKSKPS